MRKADVLRTLKEHRSELRDRFGVKELLLFGSVARDEAGPMSDVDVLVEFDGPADFDRFMGLKLYLEDVLSTRVDVVTKTGLRSRLRSSVERDAVNVS